MIPYPEAEGTVWEHLEELRRVLIRSLYLIILAIGISFFFYDPLINFFVQPLKKAHADSLISYTVQKKRVVNLGADGKVFSIPEGALVSLSATSKIESLGQNTFLIPEGEFLEYEEKISQDSLFILSPMEGFRVACKTAAWVGLAITSPFWLYQILAFIAPALPTGNRRVLFPFLGLSLLFFFVGLSLAFFITIPLTNRYLELFNRELGISLWSLSTYLDYTFFLLLANGLAFELGVILLFLAHFQFLTLQTMVSKRRHMVVLAFVIGAILTPPDILSQFLLAIPLIGFYECAILYARLRNS